MSEDEKPYILTFKPKELIQYNAEIEAILIFTNLLTTLRHDARHRVLDYCKAKFNVSKPIIKEN